MNQKQLTVLVLLVALLGGLGLLLRQRQSQGWQSGGAAAGGKLLADFPLNDVAQVAIKQQAAQLTLVRAEDTWTVQERGGYPANYEEISGLLRKVWDLKPLQKPKVGATYLAQIELVEPGKGDKSGTLVEFRDKEGKPIQSLLLGKPILREGGNSSPFGGGGSFADSRFVMLPGKPDSVSIVAEAFSNLEPKAETWLSKDFFKVERPRLISVTATNASAAWQVSRDGETNDWKLAGAKAEEVLDPVATGAFASLLSAPGFTDVVSKPGDELFAGKATVRIETLDGFAYDLQLAPKAGGEEYHLKLAVSATLPKERPSGADEKPEDKERLDKAFEEKRQKLEQKLKEEKRFEGWAFVVGKWTVESLLKERKDLLKKKDEGEAKDAAASPAGLPPFKLPTN
jgi:hypothetical protein